MDFGEPEIREAVLAMIAQVEGRPCVNFGEYNGGVYVRRRISGLEIDEEDCFDGACERVDPEDARPGELTDGMAIGCDCLRLGPGWFQDTYFGRYFVYDPALVARSIAGDHSWVKGFTSPGSPEHDRSATAGRIRPPEEGRGTESGAVGVHAAVPENRPARLTAELCRTAAGAPGLGHETEPVGDPGWRGPP